MSLLYCLVSQHLFNATAHFLLLGADDVFVYLDAWKQSGKEGPGITADLATRVHWTYRRAVGAMYARERGHCVRSSEDD